MNFKEWGNQIANMGRPGWIRKGPNISRMFVDWKAEREKLIGALIKIALQGCIPDAEIAKMILWEVANITQPDLDVLAEVEEKE